METKIDPEQFDRVAREVFAPVYPAIAERTIDEYGLQERADVLRGDVENIPLPDGSVDLAVSRGSIFFWEDLPRAFSEIRRVLSPGGAAYIGGGFGSKKIREAIVEEMKSRNRGEDKFGARVRRNLGEDTRAKFEAALEKAGIDSYEILSDEEIGLWILMRK